MRPVWQEVETLKVSDDAQALTPESFGYLLGRVNDVLAWLPRVAGPDFKVAWMMTKSVPMPHGFHAGASFVAMTVRHTDGRYLGLRVLLWPDLVRYELRRFE